MFIQEVENDLPSKSSPQNEDTVKVNSVLFTQKTAQNMLLVSERKEMSLRSEKAADCAACQPDSLKGKVTFRECPV